MYDPAHFNRQLASTLDLWTRLLREGYSVLQIIEIAASNAPEPTATVMQNTIAEAQRSGDLAKAIATMPNRMGSPYLRNVVDVILNQRETGGNLATMLDELNSTQRKYTDEDTWGQDIYSGDTST